jgi:hypothetical protein
MAISSSSYLSRSRRRSGSGSGSSVSRSARVGCAPGGYDRRRARGALGVRASPSRARTDPAPRCFQGDHQVGAVDRQRHASRARRGRLVARRKHGISLQDRRRPRLDELLPRLPGACGLRRLQTIGNRPGKSQEDARARSADQKYAGEYPVGDFYHGDAADDGRAQLEPVERSMPIETESAPGVETPGALGGSDCAG